MKFLSEGATLVEKGKKERLFSHASFSVFTEKEIHVYSTSRSVQFFDLSSLTKVLATFFILLYLFEQKVLHPDHNLGEYLKDGNDELKRIRIRELMNHTSGLPAWFPFYKYTNPLNPEPSVIKNLLLHIRPSKRKGVKLYSDIGFMILGILVEEITAKNLGRNFEEDVKKLWGVKELFFNQGKDKKFFAPTGYSRWRKKWLRGEVHDDNAYAMGGRAGHAGLFGTALEIGNLMKKFLKVIHGKENLLSPETIEMVIEKNGKKKFISGWDYPSTRNSSAGDYFSSFTIGHLGFTGTSIWVDMERKFGVVLLTNRTVYGTGKKRMHSFRRIFHNKVVRSIA